MAYQDYVKELLVSEDEYINRLNEIVMETIKEELITQKVYEESPANKLTLGERISDKVASFGGSWKFISSFSLGLVIWTIINSYVLVTHPFDPYPFILLNLILSCIAALQAPVIKISQNRKEEKTTNVQKMII